MLTLVQGASLGRVPKGMFRSGLLALSLVAVSLSMARGAEPPVVGGKAPDFTLNQLDGNPVKLSELTEKSQVVLVVLRGWPGYQCPICTRQVGDLINHAEKLAAAKAHVVLIYPGPAAGLKEHAAEFMTGTKLPANFSFVIDPDYAFTNAYGLRWNAPRETAYPSTFVIDRENTVQLANVSKAHGGRTSAADVLKVLKK